MHNVTAAEAVRNANEILEAMGFKTVVQYNEPQTSAEATLANAALKTRRREFQGRACARLLDGRPVEALKLAMAARWVEYAESRAAEVITNLFDSEKLAAAVARRRATRIQAHARLIDEMAAAGHGASGSLAIILEADDAAEKCAEYDVERPAPSDPWIARARAILAEERANRG